jgi:hypothetical protein
MKKILLSALCCFIVLAAIAQDKNTKDKKDLKKGTFGKLSQSDRLVFNVFSDIWMNAPSSSVMKIKKVNRGADVYLMKNFQFGKSNFSFALGAGVGCNNIYSNAMPSSNYSYDSLGQRKDLGTTSFKTIPTQSPDSSQTINYKNNKFTTVFLDIPLEFRYRLKNNAFKFYLGGKFGFLLSDHNKYNGDDYTQNYPTGNIRVKYYKIANIQSIRYGITGRIGWKWIQVYGYYSLSKLFKKDKGPDMYPISVGLTLSPY